jgi:hypothetical protein
MKTLRVIAVAAMVFLGLVAMTGTAGAQPTGQSAGAFVCTAGNVPAGVYKSVLIKGVCYMRRGNVVIQHDLTVAPKALLDAVTPGDPPGKNAQLPATVLVGGNVNVGPGGVLLLGCSPDQGCNGGVNYDRVAGDLTAVDDLSVVVHSATIGGNVSLLGGGGGVAGAPGSGACFAPNNPIPAPWSADPALNGSPVFTDFEDTTIGGSYTVAGVRTCWLGTFRTSIAGSTAWIANRTSDPDGNEMTTNRVGGSLICQSNLPAVQFGDSGGSPNIVGGHATGQCGFTVILPKTPPEGPTPVTQTHITIPASNLSTFVGVHTQIRNVQSLPPVTTVAGDTLAVDINNVVLAGRGLTGPITFNRNAPPGSFTGETVFTTVHPDGSQSFTALDVCACTFHGRSGTVQIEATGTSTAKGFTVGTFVIRAAGGGLARLAGWGTFSSAHQPEGSLVVVEHLEI